MRWDAGEEEEEEEACKDRVVGIACQPRKEKGLCRRRRGCWMLNIWRSGGVLVDVVGDEEGGRVG